MSEHIYAEFNTFCYAIMLGAICGILYDVIRIFRRIIKKGIAITAIEDIIYWMIVSVLMFMLMYRENGGMVRGYAVFGMAAGMILYEISIGRFFVKYVSFILNRILSLLKIGINKFIKILKIVLKKIIKPFTIIINSHRDKAERNKQKKLEKKEAVKRTKEEKINGKKKGKVHEHGKRKNESSDRKGKKKRK